jgi:hypothetical protein
MEEPVDQPTYKTELKNEIENLARTDILSPAYLKKKLILWFARNMITALLCWYYWEKPWIKWVFWIGITVAVINLLMILLGPLLLRRKLASLRQQIERTGGD